MASPYGDPNDPPLPTFFSDLYLPLIAERAHSERHGKRVRLARASEDQEPPASLLSSSLDDGGTTAAAGGLEDPESSSQEDDVDEGIPQATVAALSTSTLSQGVPPALGVGPVVGAPAAVPVNVSQPTTTLAGAAGNLLPTQAAPLVAAPATAPALAPLPSARSPFHPHAGGGRSLWTLEAEANGQGPPRWGCVHCRVSYTRPKTLSDHHDSQHADHRYCAFSCCVNNPHLPVRRALTPGLNAAYIAAQNLGQVLPYVLANRSQYYV